MSHRDTRGKTFTWTKKHCCAVTCFTTLCHLSWAFLLLPTAYVVRREGYVQPGGLYPIQPWMGGGGVPQPGPAGGGGTPARSSHGGVPWPGLTGRGLPQPDPDRGVPQPGVMGVPNVGYPPGTGQQMQYLIRYSRYASCVQAGLSWFNINLQSSVIKCKHMKLLI